MVIPFGVDIKKYKPGINGDYLKKTFGIPQGAKVLFSLQRLDNWKRVDVILKAFKSILKQMDVYLIIGGKGPEKNNLMRMADEMGISARTIFTGYILSDELPFFYAMADLFVFHSIYETLGMVLIQAMASGKPVISVNNTAIPEVIEHNKTGILVDPLDPEQLATAVTKLLRDEKSMERFARNGRQIASEKYDWNQIAEKYEEIFSQSISK